MNWSEQLPVAPGVYLWREIGQSAQFGKLCRIHEIGNCLAVTFELAADLNPVSYALSDVAKREWLRIPEDSYTTDWQPRCDIKNLEDRQPCWVFTSTGKILIATVNDYGFKKLFQFQNTDEGMNHWDGEVFEVICFSVINKPEKPEVRHG